MFFRLCSRAPRTTIASPLADRRSARTGLRRGRAIDGQVVAADVHQESQTRPDLLEDLFRDLAVAAPQAALLTLEAAHPVERLAHGEARHVDDVLAEDRDRERLGLETAALADRAGPLAHVL